MLGGCYSGRRCGGSGSTCGSLCSEAVTQGGGVGVVGVLVVVDVGRLLLREMVWGSRSTWGSWCLGAVSQGDGVGVVGVLVVVGAWGLLLREMVWV